MSLKKTDYSYFRRIYPEAAANCYTGSLSELFRMYGNEVEEYIMYIVGNGFRFFEGIDEYGDPKIFYDLIKMAETFCYKSGCSLEYIDIDNFGAKKQMLDILKNKHLIVWVNSKHLQYSDLYYSQEGYLHAILLEKIISPELIRIRDSLIVSTPSVNCIADFHIDLLEKSILDQLEKPELFDVMGRLILLNINENNPIKFHKDFLITNLYNSSLEIIEDFNNDNSAILKYCRNCEIALEEGDVNRKIWLLQKINRSIKALWVIPNRKLFYKILPSLNLNKNDEEKLLQNLEELINGWIILANYCLKCSVQSDFHGLDLLGHYFLKANHGEEIFWNQMVDILSTYCSKPK